MHAHRAAISILAILVFLVPSSAVMAQHPAGHGGIDSIDNTILVEDKPGDVIVSLASKATGQQQPGSQVPMSFDHIDIVKLEVGEETEKTFKIKLGLKSLTNSNPTGVGFPFRTVSFHYGRVPWSIYLGPCNQRMENADTKACLRYGDSARGMRPVKEFTLEKDGQTAIFPIEKAWLFNENRVPPRFGEGLMNLSAQATHWYGGIPFPLPVVGEPTGGVYASDRAPDTGVHPTGFIFNKGSNARGHLALIGGDPIRVSNGEATTIVYKVEALNHHVEKLTMNLEPKGVPGDWSVRTPALLELPPSSTTVFPVILSLPFTHEHGKTFTFEVAAQALEDTGSSATVTLGVYWTEIPQPSAHHETDDGGTFFHSAPIANERTLDQLEGYLPTYQMWMNGIDEDPDPAVKDTPVPSAFNELIGCGFRNPSAPTVCGTDSAASWFFPLSPPLLMGLDYDLSRSGRFTFEILPKLSSPTARAQVKLVYCDPELLTGARNCLGNQTTQMGSTCPANYPQVIAEGKQEGALTANTPASFDIEFRISENKWDIIPYKQGSNIGMCITLFSQVPQNGMFSPAAANPEFVVKKARLRQPLIEYHDPIDQAFVNVGALNLVAKDPFEKMVNPGETTIFRYELKTNSKQAMPVILEVQGINKDWVTLQGPSEFHLKPGEVVPVVVAVSAPAESVAEERAELFIVAQSRDDASVITVSRLRATVVNSPDLPDELELLGAKETEDTPGPGLVLGVVGLVGLAWLRRRRSA